MDFEDVTVSGDGMLVRVGDLVWYEGNRFLVASLDRLGSDDGEATLGLSLPGGVTAEASPRRVLVDPTIRRPM